MASEDSDQVMPGFLAIHGLCDLCQLDEPLGLEMATLGDQANAASELHKIPLLRRSHRMLIEERDHRLDQVRPTLDHVVTKVLTVVVVTSVDIHAPDPEKPLEVFEAPDALHALRHDELVSDLVAGLVAFSVSPAWLPDEANGEASFSVYKTNNPTEPDQPFLLIFRTVRIVTAIVIRDHTRKTMASTGRILGFSSI
jgi:hypothetical protein